MEDESENANNTFDRQDKLETSAQKPQRKKSSRRKSKKSVFIEYSKLTHSLKVIVKKIRGEKVKSKVHKSTTLKPKKSEKSLVKEKKTPIKNLKVKSRRNASVAKDPAQSDKILEKKSPLNKVKLESGKSTKRVLLKTMVVKESKSRQLRSGTKLGKPSKTEAKKSSPRTRSQKKKQDDKADTSKIKRKVISKLVESIK
jgi:hypothetical protein